MEDASRGSSRRITLVADELLGYRGNGLGTTTTFLAVALARLGHQVEVLYLGPPRDRVVPEWQGLYESAGVAIRAPTPGTDRIEPAHFARPRDVARALEANPPDVVIAQDLGAPAYVALRLRRLGLAFDHTLFVVLCHGTRQWIADATRKIRVLPGALAISVLERATIELADVIVSPSAYMVGWMESQGWDLPEQTHVIPHPTRSEATGDPRPAPTAAGERVQRVAFFGRLEERKGLLPFAAALNRLDPALLGTVELEFLGRATPAWPPERVSELLSEPAKAALRSVAFETDLDQHEVLARLARPGTLVVMPSLEDNSPNTVYECIERGLPFILSNVGGGHELVATDDRERVLFEPTADGIAEALERALTDQAGLRPVEPAHGTSESTERWAEVVGLNAAPAPRRDEAPVVDVVVTQHESATSSDRCLTALEGQGYSATNVVRAAGASVEAARGAALPGLESEWVVFLDEEDAPEADLLEKLVKAQQASDADVVSCGVHVARKDGGRTIHLFPGQPRGLGVVANGYGNTALIRRSSLVGLAEPNGLWPVEGDADWPLLARLDLAGARIVSVPLPLVTRSEPPGTIERHPSDALLVIEHVERVLPAAAASAARLAGGLAADAQRQASVPPADGLARRTARLLRNEGARGLGQRVVGRLRRLGR